MRSLRLPVLLVTCLLVARASSAQRSPLAEAARLVEQQRRTGPVAVRAYANRDLFMRPSNVVARAAETPAAQAPGTTSVAAGAAPAATQPVPATSATEAQPAASAAIGVPVTSARPWGRIAFFVNAAQLTPDEGEAQGYAEFVTTVAVRSAESAQGLEFGLDTRMAGYSGVERDPRVSIYDAWAGVRLMDGALRVRGGQMWVADLGGLGAIAGGLVGPGVRWRAAPCDSPASAGSNQRCTRPATCRTSSDSAATLPSTETRSAVTSWVTCWSAMRR